MKIYVTEAFKFAHRGHDVKIIPEGEQEVTERCADIAFSNNWARKQAKMPDNKALNPPKNKARETIQPDNAYPIHKGAGYYELSNGEKVRGKAKAIKAQKELD